MKYEDWKPLYKKIVQNFNFSIEKDRKAALILNDILDKKNNLLDVRFLKNLIEEKEVIVFGAGNSIKRFFNGNISKWETKTKIAADGATTALIERGIYPDIITTDLDGKVTDQIEANEKASIVIIHAHGDNIDKIRDLVNQFSGKIIGTTQINPSFYKNLYNFGGFTDGDRGVFLADYFNSKSIGLVGFDYDEEIGDYSFTKNSDKDLKFKKLEWCKYLIELLKRNNSGIYYI